MRRNTVIAGVLAVVLLTVAVGAGLAATTNGTQGSDGRTVTVAGSGEIEAEPDAAVVQLAVTARGSNAANVSDEVAAGASRLRSTLADFGVPEENVQTQRYVIHDASRPDEEDGQPVYVGEQTFEVTLDDVDRVGPMIDAAVDGGADNVGGVYYTLSDERQDRVRDRALRSAIDDARSEASVVANATDLRLAGVQRASSGQTSVSPYRTEVALTGGDAAGGTDIDPRDVTVSATVEVTFAATPA